MQLGLIGLGRMGGNMARRMLRGAHDVSGYDRDLAITQVLQQETGLQAAGSVDELVAKLEPPRTVWLMLPAGAPTEQQLERLAALLAPGDLVVDGANSHYKDSMRRGARLAERDISFVDAGVSGGVWGLENGYAMMLGGSLQAVKRIEPIVVALAPAVDRGWLHCGPIGAGHFVKMIHNGIEYGMMQSYAEGLALLEARKDFQLDLAAITEMWRHGSVVRSWLLDLTAEFLARDTKLEEIQPYVADSGEGRWTALEAVEQGIPAPVMSLALMMRFASQGKADYASRLLAMMRLGFGGHPIQAKI
jgi:6-phosphogluconate dehydrogenase